MDAIRSFARQFNQSCTCFSIDKAALAQALQAESVLADWWPHWQDTHAHLFSNCGLFVSDSELQAMRQAVQVLSEVMSLPAWQAYALSHDPHLVRNAQGPRGVFMGYDFHLTQAGPG